MICLHAAEDKAVAKRHMRGLSDDFWDLHMALETVRAQLEPVTQFLSDLQSLGRSGG